MLVYQRVYKIRSSFFLGGESDLKQKCRVVVLREFPPVVIRNTRCWWNPYLPLAFNGVQLGILDGKLWQFQWLGCQTSQWVAKVSGFKYVVQGLPYLKLTARTWKWMIGRRSFPFGARPIFTRECGCWAVWKTLLRFRSLNLQNHPCNFFAGDSHATTISSLVFRTAP